ncbi:hypothetical protein HanXRQr2_Chr08g0348691 [Helianthus annuus]|uniref:Uncharacterized protein n=1 Tax=Helianthus annuus TaxID=4232 RepID=A0A9K3IG95_HELAN|nr:hypothetical protein HanXRQr2_Chr08g0348691 [Helianthus annuus]KAJ0539569.1 hypothetical protein HanHA300_Chr08g0287881 [Helianthus annuus]KAJ0719898.1 hypothetical protein HanLR1_Chr08g0286911 [Helianthus annuus]KAJ0723127.1 hypothetical protein HanOQP8_Chr08g0294441 [Helianthus annuus]
MVDGDLGRFRQRGSDLSVACVFSDKQGTLMMAVVDGGCILLRGNALGSPQPDDDRRKWTLQDGSFHNRDITMHEAFHSCRYCTRYGNLGMSKWYRVPVRNQYQISRTDSIFGTDILRFRYGFGTGFYIQITVSTGTVTYRVFSVPVPIPIFWVFRYRY